MYSGEKKKTHDKNHIGNIGEEKRERERDPLVDEFDGRIIFNETLPN